MTVCVAAACDGAKALVLVADKMVGMGYVTSELDITKMRSLHKDCWILFSGGDITSIFDIIDYARAMLRERISLDAPAPLAKVVNAVQSAYEKKRLEDAESLYLKPVGWTMVDFKKEGHTILPNAAQVQADIERFTLPIELMVAAFDNEAAYIFDLMGYGEKRGITNRYDIPGFQAIGSGSTVAAFMMYYRDFSPKESVRAAVYHALEAKYYAENATGVGESTDIFVARPGKELISLSDEETIEKKLIPICYALSPGVFTKKHRRTLNNLPELDGFPEVPEEKPATKPLASKKSAGQP
jgi:20S proteasome alpha/beta subunit